MDKDRRDVGAFIESKIDDMGLDPITFRVYARIVRIAGNSGISYESPESMAFACRIGLDELAQAFAALIKLGLIAWDCDSSEGVIL